MVRSARSGRATIRGVSDFFEKIKAGAAAGSPSPRGAINTRAIPGAFRWPSQTGARGRQHRVSAGSLLNSASSPTHQLASAATDNIKVSLEARHIASEMMEGGKKKKKKTSLKACMASLHPRPCLTSEGPMPRAPQTRDVATHRTRPRQSRVHRPATRCALRNRNARGSSQWRSPSSHSFRATPPRRPACNRWRRWGECISTNLAGAGLRSVARNNKATRLLTRPGQATKSSAKDLSLRIVKLQSAS